MCSQVDSEDFYNRFYEYLLQIVPLVWRNDSVHTLQWATYNDVVCNVIRSLFYYRAKLTSVGVLRVWTTAHVTIKSMAITVRVFLASQEHTARQTSTSVPGIIKCEISVFVFHESFVSHWNVFRCHLVTNKGRIVMSVLCFESWRITKYI